MLRSPQPSIGGQFNNSGPMKAMNRTITHNDTQPRNMTYDDIHSGNNISGAFTHNTTN